MLADLQRRLDLDGFAVLPGIFSASDVPSILHELDDAFAADGTGATLRTEEGRIYGARNLLQLWPGVNRHWQRPPLIALLRGLLGDRFGLVRVLYFDKPPGQSWALPWHKDMTIAVKNHRLPGGQFTKPTFKAGVPHVEGPEWLLEQMVTLRLHLDDMTEENGPLKVIPGSHRHHADAAPVTILGQRGDVLLMRPLLSHCSNKSKEGTHQHRRILHFEFAGVEELPDGFAWHDYVLPTTTGESPIAAIR